LICISVSFVRLQFSPPIGYVYEKPGISFFAEGYQESILNSTQSITGPTVATLAYDGINHRWVLNFTIAVYYVNETDSFINYPGFGICERIDGWVFGDQTRAYGSAYYVGNIQGVPKRHTQSNHNSVDITENIQTKSSSSEEYTDLEEYYRHCRDNPNRDHNKDCWYKFTSKDESELYFGSVFDIAACCQILGISVYQDVKTKIQKYLLYEQYVPSFGLNGTASAATTLAGAYYFTKYRELRRSDIPVLTNAQCANGISSLCEVEYQNNGFCLPDKNIVIPEIIITSESQNDALQSTIV